MHCSGGCKNASDVARSSAREPALTRGAALEAAARLAYPARMPGDERARVLELLRAFGWNATSFQMLEPGLRYWFASSSAARAGCVAYVDTGRAWVAAGAPLAADPALGAVARGFVQAAHAAGRQA